MVLGRMLFALVFILAGIHKIMNWDASEQALTTSMLDMLSHTYEQPWAQKLFDTLMPYSSKLLLVGVIFELLGGLFVFLGFQVRLGALLLFLLLIPTTILFHPFWNLEGAEKTVQMTMFLKNVSLLGGTLILLACGSGPKVKKADV